MDFYKAEKLKSIGVEVPEELWPHIEDYVDRRKEDARQMLKFLNEENFSAIDRVAHKVRGNGSSYGFDSLSECANEIQDSLRGNDRVGLEKNIGSFNQQVERIKSFLVSS